MLPRHTCSVKSAQMLQARHTQDGVVEVGIDEAGRGCLWGPLFAAAVVWPAEEGWTDELRTLSGQIKDSKKVTPKRRAALEEAIQAHAIAWGLGRVDATEIDAIGMTRANRLAFQRALEAVTEKGVHPGRILIDGILGLTDDVVAGREQCVLTKGDGTYLAIAAASILAKEGHDRAVRVLCEEEPELHERYGLLSSKGYGTAAHQAAIRRHGMHAEHRKLFLRKLLGLEHTVHGEVQGVTRGYNFLED
jgi:ribonuclease HII